MNERDFSSEFTFITSRSSGAGGQHINKVETRVTLLFNVANSELLNEIEKELILVKLKNKINSEGYLLISSQLTRSQIKNKEKCIEKFYLWLENALKTKKPRKPTKPSRASKEKRLAEKKAISEKKTNRKKEF